MSKLLTPTPRVLRGLHYRSPRKADAARVHALVDACRPLDLNSPYAYLLLCTHFSATSAVAELNGAPLAFAGGYLKPADQSVLFIWQVAVSRRLRGLGVGVRLLQQVLDRETCRHVRFLEATITPSNVPSWALFRALARARGARCRRRPLFSEADFGPGTHEQEHLLRIGPFAGPGDNR